MGEDLPVAGLAAVSALSLLLPDGPATGRWAESASTAIRQ